MRKNNAHLYLTKPNRFYSSEHVAVWTCSPINTLFQHLEGTGWPYLHVESIKSHNEKGFARFLNPTSQEHSTIRHYDRLHT